MTIERFAIPKKGRIHESILQLCMDAGLKIQKPTRLDMCVCDAMGVEIYFLPAKDIPNAVASGAIHYGITGVDLIEDAHAKVDQHMTLGLGRARMVLASPEEHEYLSPKSLEGKKIGTSYLGLTQSFLQKHDVQNVELVDFSGSVEIQVRLGVVDAIVDITETGTSLRANGLKVRETLLESEMVFIGSAGWKSDFLDRITKRFNRVIRGRSHYMLKFNLPENKLEEATALSHGFSSPTVNHLAEKGWLAIEVAVPKSQLHELMDKLSSMGATGILSHALDLCV